MVATKATATPHPREAEFLALDCEEGLYGGAAGAGKTESLLHWLKEGVHLPSYSGIFFRRTYPQLSRSNDSPIARSQRIYGPLGGVWKEGEKRWTFPSGAVIEFSHMQYENNKYDHQGPSYHRIAFDELTQFSETQYTYLFSRLRMHVGFPIPIGVRAASNPDGIGRIWVMNRFVTREAIDAIRELTAYDKSPAGQVFVTPAGRVFMPARVADNPTLDTDDYINRLQTQLGPVLAARLANGDWSITEGSQIDPEWLRYFTMRGEHLIPIGKDGREISAIHDVNCERFATIDTAGTSKQKAEEDKGKPPSWSVVGIWDYWRPLQYLFLRHIWRARVDWNDLKSGVKKTLADWGNPRAIVESAHHGQPLAGEIGSSARLVHPVIGGMKLAKVGDVKRAKLERAIASKLLTMMQDGQFFLPDIETVPKVAQWLPDFEAEILGWTGRPEETSDQIDVCSYAANHVRSHRSWEGLPQAGRARVRWQKR